MNLELRNAGKDCWPLPRSAVVGRHLSKAQKAQETLPKNSEIFQKDNKKDFYRKSGKNGETEPRITRIFKENEYEFGTQELRKRIDYLIKLQGGMKLR